MRLLTLFLFIVFIHFYGSIMTQNKNPYFQKNRQEKVKISDEEIKKNLTLEEFKILREKATERAFSGSFVSNKEKGIYFCKACGNALFKSDSKFDSGCGWPSFFETIQKNSIIYQPDNSHGMHRTEIICGKCSSHLGHVFDDGPQPTGLRYCLNSLSLVFEKDIK